MTKSFEQLKNKLSPEQKLMVDVRAQEILEESKWGLHSDPQKEDRDMSRHIDWPVITQDSRPVWLWTYTAIGLLAIFGWLLMFLIYAQADGVHMIKGPAPHPPNGPPITRAWHNGSMMAIIPNPQNQTLRIEYIAPKPSLWQAGVVPGTVLLMGKWVTRDNLFATAHVFDWQCGAVPYEVRGGVDAGGALVLQGPAPVVWRGGCLIAEYIWTHNSYLRFEPVRE